MDSEEELFMFDWEPKVQDSQTSTKIQFVEESNDDDDYILALSLQTQFNNDEKGICTSDSKSSQFLQQSDEDYAFALSLQNQFFVEDQMCFSDSKKSIAKGSQSSKPPSIIDQEWELLDPHPDIHALFQEYDAAYFRGKLKGVEVRWSQRMTTCAGVCSYEGRGGLCSIRLSVPLLKLRPRKDLVETLLHEMIHAYLFVTCNNKDHSAHGPEFLSHMNRINKETGAKITVYHNFHDEVNLYRTHWWKCNGPCKNKRPFYGLVKRAMNRAPGPTDHWWADHQKRCGGTFIKIKEPEGNRKKPTKRKANSENKESQSDIRNLFKGSSSQTGQNSSSSSNAEPNSSHVDSSFVKKANISTLNNKSTSPKNLFVPFHGSGHKLADSSATLNKVPSHVIENSRDGPAATYSSSEKILDTIPSSSISKVPKLSNFYGNVHKENKESQSDMWNLFKNHNYSLTSQNSSSSSTAKPNSSHVESSFVKKAKISTLNSKSTSPKNLLVPFQGSGHKLADSSVSLNKVPSHVIENSRDGPAATYSSSEKMLDTIPSSSISKVPKLSNFHGNVHKDETSRSMIKSNATKNLVQSPIEKFLSSKVSTNDGSSVTKKSLVNQFNDQTSSDLKVSCPVCFNLIKEQEINSHLDTCLSS